MLRNAAALVAKVGVACILIPLLYLLKPWRHVRIGYLMAERIGHFTANIDLFMRRRQIEGDPPRVRYFFICYQPSNRQLLTMWQRHLVVFESKLLSFLYLSAATILERTPFVVETAALSVEGDVYDAGTATLSFTPEEEARGRAELARMGIGPNDWFICFHARDPAYLAALTPGLDRSDSTFRDCSITNYLKAAQHVVDLGGFAIRMGELTQHQLPSGLHPHIIDYARMFRSDFLDIYLPAKCRFFLCSTSGILMVSSIFDVPVAVANFVPLAFVAERAHDLFTPKLVRAKADGRMLPFAELHQRGLFDMDRSRKKIHTHMAANGLEWVENSEDEILDLTLDMLDRLRGVPPSAEGKELQKQYHRRFRSHMPDHRHCGDISARFIVRHKALMV